MEPHDGGIPVVRFNTAKWRVVIVCLTTEVYENCLICLYAVPLLCSCVCDRATCNRCKLTCAYIIMLLESEILQSVFAAWRVYLRDVWSTLTRSESEEFYLKIGRISINLHGWKKEIMKSFYDDAVVNQSLHVVYSTHTLYHSGIYVKWFTLVTKITQTVTLEPRDKGETIHVMHTFHSVSRTLHAAVVKISWTSPENCYKLCRAVRLRRHHNITFAVYIAVRNATHVASWCCLVRTSFRHFGELWKNDNFDI